MRDPQLRRYKVKTKILSIREKFQDLFAKMPICQTLQFGAIKE